MNGDLLRARLLAAYADEHRDHLAVLRAVLAAGAGDIEEAYRHAHSLKGAARAVDLPGVVELAHRLEGILQEWWETGTLPDPATLAQARKAVDGIEDLSADALGARPVAATEETAATMRVEAEALETLAVCTTQLLAETERRRGHGKRLRQAIDDGRVAEALRLLDEADWALGRAAEAVAGNVARLRMVAAEVTLGNFGPMLRALAAELGKDVRYDAEGLATLADRHVLSVVAEAVMHLLRNAVAHGIEAPARRVAAGKEPAGRLTLSVAAPGPSLEIRICDDGEGIPMARLAEEAVAHGLLTAEQAADADEERLRQLVFLPGLSSAGSVDTTAGRGMGMAIVRRLMDQLQGQVELRSRRGAGTEVLLSMPVSILAQRVVLLRAGSRRFALPAAAVVRVLPLAADALIVVEGRAMVVVDGAELPVVTLASMLGMAESSREGDLLLALVRTVDGVLALAVEGAEDVRELWISPLDPAWGNDPRLAGTVTLEEGHLALVLAPAGLRASAGLSRPPIPGKVRRRSQVLVVDDSPTIRALERSILEANSYRVEVAQDGCEALERMTQFRPDVVVSDVQMPRLDGLGLLAAMRSDPGLAQVPVVLLSSRVSEADRQAGRAAGAVAYLAKTAFDQDEFLNTIRRYTG